MGENGTSKKFVREKSEKATDVIAIIIIAIVIFMAGGNALNINFPTVELIICIVVLVTAVIALCCIEMFAPEDFSYIIYTCDDGIVLELSEEDRRILKRTFVEVHKTKKYVLLDDGIARMEIPYNNEVLEYLESLKENQK